MNRRGFLRTPLLALAAYATARKATPAPEPVVKIDQAAFRGQIEAAMWPELRQMISWSVVASVMYLQPTFGEAP